jgi:beta-glucanase (GH16 family)
MHNFIQFFTLFFVVSITACGSKKDDVVTPDLPQLSISHQSKLEGNSTGNFEFTVRLSVASANQASVDYATVDKSAVAGEDYVAASGSLTFAPGETEKSFPVSIVPDTLREGDEEFRVQLSNPVNAVIAVGTALGTIRNDDTFLPGNDDGYASPESYAGYNLVWQDEFEGSEIDPNNWIHETGSHGWGNNEWQNYTNRPDNSFISNGKLVIEAKKESWGGADYTSARMVTKGLREFKYGRVDIRAKLPIGKGIWPALWMLGNDISTVNWPKCGEIDIMEIIGSEPSTLHGTIHWDNNGHASYGNSTKLTAGTFADEFHVFSIIWDDQTIKWLLDDVQFNAADISPAGLSEFHHPFFFIFNVAVGGNWPGYPDATTVFPQRMWVDYIRVFQKG